MTFFDVISDHCQHMDSADNISSKICYSMTSPIIFLYQKARHG